MSLQYCVNTAELFCHAKSDYKLMLISAWLLATKKSLEIYFRKKGYLYRVNRKGTPLVVNSFYIIDDAKQRNKMTEEFYLTVKKEIAAYQEKCDDLIKNSINKNSVGGSK